MARKKVSNRQIQEAMQVHNSTRKAAEALGISHTAVNKRVNQMKAVGNYSVPSIGGNRSGTPLIYGQLASDQKRDTWQVAGFPDEVTPEMLYTKFRRSGFARAAIMRPVQKCWSTTPKIYDFKGEGEPEAANTQFEKDVQYLIDDMDLFKWLYSLDYRQRVGRYGGIIIIAKEIDGNKKKTVDPVQVAGVKNIIKFVPVFEQQIKEGDIDNDMQSANFGNPKTYNYNPNLSSTHTHTAPTDTILDKSRVFVFGEGADDGSIYGTPALEAGFNDLLNLEKVGIASAEGLYKNAKQRLHVNVTDENVASAMFNADEEDEFDESMKSFAAGFDAEFFTSGMEVKTLQSTMMDPTGPANVALQAYCASVDIPKTVLIGFETGERSSSENKDSWNETNMSRRSNTLNDMIKGFLSHLVEIGALTPPSNGICVEWDDLMAASDEDKLNNSNKMADVNQKSFNSGGGQVFDENEIRKAAGYAEADIEDFEGDEEGELIDDEIEE
jgi:hypothetical protein